MEKRTIFILIFKIVLTSSKEEDLPLCPTNIQFFPQNLPMHCRMPSGAEYPSFPGMGNMPTVPPGQQPFYPQPGDKQPGPIAMPMPPNMHGPMPPGLPGPIPMPMPMPPGPSPKVPVIVMPFYSQDPSYTQKKIHNHQRPHTKRRHKKKKHLYEDSSDTDTDTETDTDISTDTSSDTSSDKEYWKGYKKGWRKNARKSRRSMKSKQKQLLTPILQYVTNDGYVIFEKKISKDEANGWLKPSDEKNKDDVDYVNEKENTHRQDDFDDLKDHIIDQVKKEKVTTVKNHPQRRHHLKSTKTN